METILDAPLLDQDRRRQNHYLRRWAFVGAVLLSSGYGLVKATEQAVHGATDLGEQAARAIEGSIKTNAEGPSITKKQLDELTKVYVVQPGNTVWSIASAESQAVANNPELLFQAQNEIEAQIPGDNASNLAVGETIKLPSNSAIGVTESKR